MVRYKNLLIIFGGAGPYIPSIKMRLSYNDIHIFDMVKEEWAQDAEY